MDLVGSDPGVGLDQLFDRPAVAEPFENDFDAEAWSSLPPAVRAGLLAMVQVSRRRPGRIKRAKSSNSANARTKGPKRRVLPVA